MLISLIELGSSTTDLTTIIVREHATFDKRNIFEFRLEKLYDYAPIAPVERFESL